MYTVISATDDQINAFYRKHMEPFFKKKIFGKRIKISKYVPGSVTYSYDGEDGIGFFSVNTISGKRISCQVRGGCPMFVELTGFGQIRYDICYPGNRENCKEFYEELKSMCQKAKEDFWKGGHI